MSTSKPTRDPTLVLTHFEDQTLPSEIQVHLPSTITKEQFQRLLPKSPTDPPAFTFVALRNWLSKLLKNLGLQENGTHPYHKHPYKFREIDVQAVDWFWKSADGRDGKLGFMKIQARIETDPYWHPETQKTEPGWLPGAVFLRGGSVAMLIVLQPSDSKFDNDKHAILTIQPRPAAASLAFTEIPAGMLDDGTFKGTAAKEIAEEAGLTVTEDSLLNMSELAISSVPTASFDSDTKSETVESAMYPSVGACDEFIPIMLCQKRLTRRHMEWLRGKATGLRDEGERITLKLVPLGEVWKEAGRDAKALAAVALYDGLRSEGKIPDMPEDVEVEPDEVRDQSD
ncbi:ADP-sugar diphosphatase [Setomelanomma holmii]|uniref:ADP-sugar diphosphatase n=1 Tax=Setomelanomma holmii TaxID=210430 RepID=A0A9P4H473_9PLEO|nr:ADP-sugar diphosphatase [Setomelanomma holmii]